MLGLEREVLLPPALSVLEEAALGAHLELALALERLEQLGLLHALLVRVRVRVRVRVGVRVGLGLGLGLGLG